MDFQLHIDMTYSQCSICWRIRSLPLIVASSLDEPCPDCGVTGKTRIQWPPIEATEFMRIVWEQDLNDGDGHKVALVFLNTALELLLEYLLWDLLAVYTDTGPFARLMLEGYSRRSDRIKLYRRLRGRSLKDNLIDLDFPDFYDEWDRVNQERNKLIHGRYFSGYTSVRPPLKNVSSKGLPAFVALVNDAQKFRDSNPDRTIP